jgi:hypothetical protein
MTAKIKFARVAAAHEGNAELIVCLEYDNGGLNEIALDHVASHTLMKACNAATLEDLVGSSWENIREALQVSYNRYT